MTKQRSILCASV